MRRGLEDSNEYQEVWGGPGGRFALFHNCDLYIRMLIRLDDNTLVDDLCAHYRRSGFSVEHMGGGMVDVARENAPTPEQERHEVLLHLRVWEAVNPDTRGELLA
jgi:hypothetical protein